MSFGFRQESNVLVSRHGVDLVFGGGSPFSCGITEDCEFGLYVIECQVRPGEVPVGQTRYYVGQSAFPPETRFWEHMGGPIPGRFYDPTGSLPFRCARRLAPELYALIGGFHSAAAAREGERALAERLALAGLPSYMDGNLFNPPAVEQGLARGWQDTFSEQHCDARLQSNGIADPTVLRQQLDLLHQAIPHAADEGLPVAAPSVELRGDSGRLIQSLYESRVVTQILRLKHRMASQQARVDGEYPGICEKSLTSRSIDVGTEFSLVGAIAGDFVLVEKPTGSPGEISRSSPIGAALLGLREGATFESPIAGVCGHIEVRSVKTLADVS
ncbi:MAG: hypothetical protein QM648_00795 [Solirubrobacterales bacterium]